MCGVCGQMRLSTREEPLDDSSLKRMSLAMRERGPDGCGLWYDDSRTVGLAHRRLAIIDLSDAGAQPMASVDGRYRIVFNGEIYNYRELRTQLGQLGAEFASHSDTEVILLLFAREGPKMLERLRGMFALAIWDAWEERLFLARDLYGIKPLYYAVTGDLFQFASQVKALEAGGKVSLAMDPAALVSFSVWGSISDPLTIRTDIKALEAGHYLFVGRNYGNVSPVSYTNLVTSALGSPPHRTVSSAIEDSVRAHLVADVPVAVFLSAGLDSSMVAALARRQGGRLASLTLRFEAFIGSTLDEAVGAREVASTLGTDHIERLVSAGELRDVWPKALAAMDQPTIDGLNTFVVSMLAKDAGLKVVLSGLGGDELFGSYESFRDVPRWHQAARWLRRIPLARSAWPSLAHILRPRQRKLAGLLNHGGTLVGAYLLRRALFLPSELPSFLGKETSEAGLASYDPLQAGTELIEEFVTCHGRLDPWKAIHLLESTHYMKNQLLRDADWASMAHSLELRVPLVDAQLHQAVAAHDFEPGRSKGKTHVVRKAAPELPEGLWRRPKSGFFIPTDQIFGRKPGQRSFGGNSRQLALEVIRAFGFPAPAPV